MRTTSRHQYNTFIVMICHHWSSTWYHQFTGTGPDYSMCQSSQLLQKWLDKLKNSEATWLHPFQMYSTGSSHIHITY